MPTTKQPLRAFFGAIIAYPKTILVIFLLGTSLLGWQARNFQIDASADTLLMQNDPDYVRTKVVNRRFSPQEFLLIAYRPRNRPLFSKQTLKDLSTLSEKLRQLDRVAAVHSILNVPLFALGQAGAAAMKTPSELTMERRHYPIDQLKQAFAGHPIYEDLLINKEQTAAALQVLFKSDQELNRIEGQITDLEKKSLQGSLSRVEEQALAQLRSQAEPIEKRLDRTRNTEIRTIRHLLTNYRDRAELYLGGLHVLSYQLIHIIKNDLVVFGGAIAAMIGVMLFLLFRKLRWVVIPILCCGCSVLTTMGLFSLFGLKTTVISSNFIALQLILTLAIVIHLIVQYREYHDQHPDWQQAELVRQTLLRKVGPCFYAGLTTAVGFASLLFSNIQPVIAFGGMMIIAVLISTLVSLILFPALLVLFAREEKWPARSLFRPLLEFFVRLTLNHRVLIGTVSAVILIGCLSGMFRLTVENSFINYFRDRTRVYQELSFIDRQFGGSTPLDIVYTLPHPKRDQDLVMTATTVQTLQRLQAALQQHPAVGKILSAVNFTEVAKKLNHDRPLTEYELTAVYWTLEDALREELLGAFFSPEHGQVRFSLRIKDTTRGLNRAELLASIRDDLANLGIAPERYTLTNLFVLYQDILQRLFRSQILTMGLVYGVLTLAFLAIFRSVKLALIGIAPNILSTLAVLGVMGWAGIPLDLMTITIAAIAMGIAVDDTIHFLHRYREELRAGPADKAIERSLHSVGYAMIYTSLIIILGFSLLAFSDFVPSILFGLLTSFAITMALLFALSLLPALLGRFVHSD
jgi:predicted RND superfamily exporter protein